MASTKLIQWSGLLSILAGVLYALSTIIHPDGEDVQAVMSDLWIPAHLLGSIAALCMLFGLIGLYAYQMGNTGRLGLTGFILSFLGSVALLIEEAQSVLITPMLAEKSPSILEQASLSGAPLVFGVIFLLTFFLGYILFAIASLRAGIFPRWSSIFLIIGLVFSFGGTIAHFIGQVAAVMFGLGWISMGYFVRSENSEIERKTVIEAAR